MYSLLGDDPHICLRGIISSKETKIPVVKYKMYSDNNNDNNKDLFFVIGW